MGAIRDWRRVRPEDCPLSARQFQCAALLALGFTREEIGQVLGIGSTTIRSHVFAGCRKLGVNTAAALASEVAVRWMRTPRSGRQHYVDEFDRRLSVVLARNRGDRRQLENPELDDLIKLTLEEDGPEDAESRVRG